MTDKFQLSDEEVGTVIDLALAEDISHGDITSEVLIPPDLTGKAVIIARETGILAGGEIAQRVFRRIDPSLKVDILIKDGHRIKPEDIIAEISGRVISILKAERVGLNFLQRLSGIASLTAQYAAAAAGSAAIVTDTRKTTPGLRLLEKYAVRMGGGHNHRFHLGDGILIKDNHLSALRTKGISLKETVTRARENAPEGIKVEVEVTTTEEAVEAMAAGADIIMLDNMSPDEMRRVTGLVAGRAKIEASGGITLANIRQVAMTGVDIISVGALTHSSKALDISIELESAD